MKAKTKVPVLWYKKQIQWINESIEERQKRLKQLNARYNSALLGFPSEHDVKLCVSISDLRGLIDSMAPQIEQLKLELKKHKEKFTPCKKTMPNWNKFQLYWIDNLQKFINYEMDYYQEYNSVIESCFICDNPDDEDCEAETEIAERIQEITQINDLVRFR
jgi:hypothetical protein